MSKSMLAEYLDRQGQEIFTPCKSLKKIAAGEKLTVNWFPVGETRAATAVRFERNCLLVRLDHSGAMLEVTNPNQVNWSEKLHSKQK